MHQQTLNGSVALISGGLGDIGRACALELARCGADIALGDLQSLNHFAEFKKQLDDIGVRSHYQQLDITDAAAVQAWVQNIEVNLGTADLIIANAGIVELADFSTLTPEIWKKQLDVNLNGAFYTAHYAAQHLRACEKSGRIVFMGSWAAHTPHVHIPAYCVSKAGVRCLCQNMALELAPYDILVNEVAPGTVNAGLSAQVLMESGENSENGEESGRAEKQRQHIPNKKLIEAIDVAKEVVHLCDPEIQHHVGATILIDGGNTLRGPCGPSVS